jgi:hypothetical protein
VVSKLLLIKTLYLLHAVAEPRLKFRCWVRSKLPPVAADGVSARSLPPGKRMRKIYLGLVLAVIRVFSNSLAMNLFKASTTLEATRPWYLRTRLLLATFLGVFVNAVMDGFAFSMTPLSLIAPLQGLTIAVVVLFAAAGVGGHYETVSQNQWRGIGVTIFGLIVCTWYGPNNDAERALWPLIRHYYQRPFQTYALLTIASCLFCLIAPRVPSLRLLVPPKGSVAWTVLTALSAGMLAGLLQTQLKVFAQASGHDHDHDHDRDHDRLALTWQLNGFADSGLPRRGPQSEMPW